MATSSELNTIAGRLATFDGPQQLAKRRASSTKKKTTTSVSWPHKTPSPEELARAGFYYKPSATSSDSVTCFLCDKALDGWDADDKPALEHLSHVPDCAWAINICIELRNQDMDRVEENPMSEKMVEARRATFQDLWPHEGKKGWKCKVKKMVGAGWCYNPLPETDDYVCCFYCGLSLDGWEPKDDPWEEHHRRAPECHFFTLIDEAKATKSIKPKKTKASRPSRSSRLSTQSNISIASEAPSLASLDDGLANEGDSVMTTGSSMSRSTRQRKPPARAKAPGKSNAKVKKTASQEEPAENEAEEATGETEAPTFWAGGVEATALRAMKSPTENMESEMTETTQPVKPVRKTTRNVKAQKKIITTVDDSTQFHAELEAEISAAFASPNESIRPKRGKKRMSDGDGKTVETAAVSTQALLRSSPARRQSPSTGAGASSAANCSSDLRRESVEGLRLKALKQEATPKVAAERLPSEVDQEASPTPRRSANWHVDARDEDVSDLQRDHAVATQPTPRGIRFETFASEAATPSRSTRSNRGRTVEKSGKSTNVELHLPRPPSVESTRSSDEENRPPSARGPFILPSSIATNTSPSKIHLDTDTRTPTTSPSGRQVDSDILKASYPWKEVDLDTIFLASPSSRQSPSKGTSRVEDVMRSLATPDKEMSVEEWILSNAKNAEEKLRQECERMIGLFEGEGVRALRTLESLQSV